MSVISKIKHDYSKIKMLLADVEALGREETELRKPLFSRLHKEIVFLHKAEEKNLHTALKAQKSASKLLETLQAENKDIEELLSDMKAAEDYNTDTWHKNFKKLKALLLQKMRDENTLLKKVEKALAPQVQDTLEEQIVHDKKELWHTQTLAAPRSLRSDFTSSIRAA